jgi:hypothetical protein
MAKVVNLLHYKYGNMNIDALLVEANNHATLLCGDGLTPLEKYRCRVVFTATYHKAETEELKHLMKSLLTLIHQYV